MKNCFVVLCLVAVALGAPGPVPVFRDYHEEVGIPEYQRLKAAEEAMDFDGSRIVGGSQSDPGQFPYNGVLLIQLHTGSSSICGCALVSHTRAVTAAHCWMHGVHPGRSVTVVLGTVRKLAGGTRRYSELVVPHPRYDESTLTNDIAIIKIDHVPFSALVSAISLASGDQDFVGQNAVATGFGVTSSNGGIDEYQPLKHVTMRVITNEVCGRFLGFTVIDSSMCTSGLGRRSVCWGDSGGPLVVGDQLVGIASFVSAYGCTLRLPSGFARVSYYHDWLKSHF